jgi:DNA-binding transcriptional LysR family regulator
LCLQRTPCLRKAAINFEDTLDFDHRRPARQQQHQPGHAPAAAQAGAPRLRIQVTGLDAMCRMIDNGLGVGVMPAAPLS